MGFRLLNKTEAYFTAEKAFLIFQNYSFEKLESCSTSSHFSVLSTDLDIEKEVNNKDLWFNWPEWTEKWEEV